MIEILAATATRNIRKLLQINYKLCDDDRQVKSRASFHLWNNHHRLSVRPSGHQKFLVSVAPNLYIISKLISLESIVQDRSVRNWNKSQWILNLLLLSVHLSSSWEISPPLILIDFNSQLVLTIFNNKRPALRVLGPSLFIRSKNPSIYYLQCANPSLIANHCRYHPPYRIPRLSVYCLSTRGWVRNRGSLALIAPREFSMKFNYQP